MKHKRLFILILAVLAALLTVLFCCACNHGNDNNAGDNTAAPTQAEAMVTESPDGEITASPTLAPDESNAPGNTDSASPAESAGPDDTEAASATEVSGDATPTPNSTQGNTNPVSPTPTNSPEIQPSLPTMSNIPVVTLPANSPTPTPAPGTTPRPTATPSPKPTATPLPDNDFVAHYAGATVDCTGLSAGGAFFWTFDLVNENSCLFAGHWLIDYPEQFLKVESYSVSWSGGITYLINQTWDDEEPWSDKPAVVCNEEYMGQTGGSPQGEAGNLYANVGMYLTSFDYNGVQMAGSLIRFKYSVKKLPGTSEMKHDAEGYYLEIPIEVIESTAMVLVNKPDGGIEISGVPHGHVSCDPGKLYFKK